MKTPTHSTRRNSTRISRRRGISNGTAAPLSPSRSSASSGPSAASECSLEVTACSLQRVNGLMLLLLCTRSNWLLYRLDNLSTTHESCSPIQMLMDPDKDTARVPNVRFIHLFGIPTEEIATQKLGALFVSERSAPLYLSDDEDEDFLPAAADVEDDNGCEDISILNLDEQKILFKLPPTPSLVLDVQTNATMAAVLCETRELFLYNLATFQLQQTIIVTSPAMALGSRWLAYPGYALSNDTTQAKGQEQSLVGKEDIDSDFDEVPIESLVLGGMATEARDMSHSSSPSYTAVDIAQNVASGLYYLSEVGRATIAPYLSSSPGRPKTDVQNGHIHTSAGSRHCIDHSQVADSKSYGLTSQQASQIDSSDKASIASKKHAGWVVMLDLVTKRILANFQCHSTALVNLSLDFSGLLLATSSTKGQNLHVYRLSPPLQSVITKPNGTLTCGLGTLHYQLAYKLQRGITHATIQDIAFSQDSKWINVTSAHGTSHLYAIHPEGARISADTHANTVESAALSDADDLGPGCLQRQVSDFYADFRALETRTQSQVLRIRHDMRAPVATTLTVRNSKGPASSKVTDSSRTSSSSSMSSTSSSSSPPGLTLHRPHATGSLRSSILDASQAFLSQLATSAIDFGHQHFENDTDVNSRRRRLRRRLCCLFVPDGLKMLICCDSILKMYDMRVTALSQHKVDCALSDPRTKNSTSSLSSFGFEASVTELKSWDLLTSNRRMSVFSSSAVKDHPNLTTGGDTSTRSELRTFAQRSLPLWAHPKVSFIETSKDHPQGRILEVKRKGPNLSQDIGANSTGMTIEGHANGDDQLFVMEMDSYFGISGSPVFDGQRGSRSTAPDVPPPLDLAVSINMAISSSLAETPSKPTPEVKNTICFGPIDTNLLSSVCDGTGLTQKGKKRKAKNLQIITPSSSVDKEITEKACSPGQLASLQFTMHDMYFAAPVENTNT